MGRTPSNVTVHRDSRAQHVIKLISAHLTLVVLEVTVFKQTKKAINVLKICARQIHASIVENA